MFAAHISASLKSSTNPNISNWVLYLPDLYSSSVKFIKNIDLVSSSIFGLQKDTVIYNNPEKFGIKKIIEEERTVLGPKISYEVKQGLTQKQAVKLRENYKKTIENINKYPKTMNFFREHMFNSITFK